MDDKALKFFEDKNLQVNKIVELGMKRYGLAEHHIKQAMEIVYREIQDGKRKDNIQISFDVCNVAKELKSNIYQDDQIIISDTRRVLDAVNEKLEKIEEERIILQSENENIRNEKDRLLREKDDRVKEQIHVYNDTIDRILEEHTAEKLKYRNEKQILIKDFTAMEYMVYAMALYSWSYVFYLIISIW